MKGAPVDPNRPQYVPEDAILVAVTVQGRTRAERLAALMEWLPDVGSNDDYPRGHETGITSWWIAEDDRTDGSDNDSAVFVDPGKQSHASRVLLNRGLTQAWNVVTQKPDVIRRWLD